MERRRQIATRVLTATVVAAAAAAATAFPDGPRQTAGWVASAVAVAEAAALLAVFRQRRRVETRLVRQAFHDPLTGLPNRTQFLDRVGAVAAAPGARARPPPSSSSTSTASKSSTTASVTPPAIGPWSGGRSPARLSHGRTNGGPLGGDEFAILLDGPATAAEALAACLADAMKAPFPTGARDLAVTASIGIATATPDHTDPADLLRDADVALYRAKERGKAGWAVFDPAMGIALRERAELEADLGRAAANGELWLAYQPVVDLASGAIVGVEALVRWQHPAWGLLQPGQFIPVAEETGQVERIGRWVLAKACRQAREWQGRFADPPVVAVNLSARQFRRPDLVEVVAYMLRETGLNPRLLKFEITESAVMGDAEAAVATLRRLKGLGVGLSIDDFGTGYSSLSYRGGSRSTRSRSTRHSWQVLAETRETRPSPRP